MMNRKIFKIKMIFAALLLTFSMGNAQNFGLTLRGDGAFPMGELSNWFDNGYSASAAFGAFRGNGWFVEAMIFGALYSNEKPILDSDEHVQLRLEAAGLWVSGDYYIWTRGVIRPFFYLAGGPFYWKGVRGEVPEISPFPNIPERILEEWNMGGESGLGLAFVPTESLHLLLNANYRFLVGSLYPTMQENVGIDGINGFSSLNLSLRIRFLF
ncbi:MAG TPA: hypothetical protein ENN84_05600 [Candidatus Marinimicrobia bacterium]|nr:hypothetical protein [Candidatus Neomarinimicrobiota bacterium]